MIRAFSLLICLLCFDRAFAADTSDLALNLADARARWEANKPTRYSFVIHAECFICGNGPNGPVRVKVRGDHVTRATYLGRAERGYRKFQPFRVEGARMPMTVPKMFELIEWWIKEPEKTAITYDPIDGHPTRIATAGGFEDDFLIYHIADFLAHDR